MRRSPVEAVWLILKVLNRYSFIGAVGLEQPNAAAWLTTSKPPPCHEYWAEPLSFSHQLTFHLYLTPNILPPRFQYAALHPSFLRRFHLPSLYISLTHFPALFRSFFCPPPPSPFLHPFAVPLPLKQSSFFLSLFIYMTPRFSQRQVRMAKGRLLQNGSGLISSPCFSSQPKSFIAELTVLLVIALSFCKYHGLSLIFILLPPLSPRTPSVDQYRLGLGARPALGSYHPPLPCSKYCIRNTKDFLGTTSNVK